MIQRTVFYKELEQVFSHFPKYHIILLLEHVNAKLGREDIFKPTIGNENSVRIVKIMVLEY